MIGFLFWWGTKEANIQGQDLLQMFSLTVCIYGKILINQCNPGGGGYSHFSSYVGLDPASTVPPKVSGISSTPKIFEILSTQKYPQFCTFTFRKYLKYIEMTSKSSPIL